MKYLEELRKLNLPIDKYAIFGSGVLAVRGIRENRDLDIIVKEELWNELKEEYEINKDGSIKVGNVEIWEKVRVIPSIPLDSFITHADLIGGFPYVRLEDLMEWKRLKDRDVDRRDIRLVKTYLNQNNH